MGDVAYEDSRYAEPVYQIEFIFVGSGVKDTVEVYSVSEIHDELVQTYLDYESGEFDCRVTAILEYWSREDYGTPVFMEPFITDSFWSKMQKALGRDIGAEDQEDIRRRLFADYSKQRGGKDPNTTKRFYG